MHMPLQSESQSDAVPREPAGTAPQESSFADYRVEAVAQRGFSEMAHGSPRALQLKSFSDAIDNCDRMRVQRRETGTLLGEGPGQTLPVKANNTDLPDNLKSGIEALSGLSMDGVKVHYNSAQPAQLNAHAYAQGNDIHLAPGQERHLPHEAWHLVQQRQGRVTPTVQLNDGILVNDDAHLEREADAMGLRALSNTDADTAQLQQDTVATAARVVQRFADDTNKARKDRAEEISRKDMQLDHAISQDMLKKFYAVMDKVGSIEKSKRPKKYSQYESVKTKLLSNQDITKTGEGALLNLRSNITPGYQATVGNVGNIFDPQIQVDGDEVSVTEQSRQLETMDRMMRSIIRKESVIQEINKLDPDSTEAFLDELDGEIGNIVEAMVFLNAEGEVPGFDQEHWYAHKDKMVKKAAAEYLGHDDPRLAEIGTDPRFNGRLKLFIKRISFTNYEIKKARKKPDILTQERSLIDVVVAAPYGAWQHIYKRHTIKAFAWDIQATNTFWKADPRAVFDAFQDEIAAELLLIIERETNIEREFHELEPGEDADDPIEGEINAAGSNFFFQGTYAMVRDNAGDGSNGKLRITLKSFAPQNAAIGYAVEPAALARMKPA